MRLGGPIIVLGINGDRAKSSDLYKITNPQDDLNLCWSKCHGVPFCLGQLMLLVTCRSDHRSIKGLWLKKEIHVLSGYIRRL